MRLNGQVVFGGLVLLFGLSILLGSLLDISPGALCFPTVLILLGVWILVRPKLAAPGRALRIAIFGPVRSSGPGEMADQDIVLFLGDVRLDLTEADIPPGETLINVYSFISNVRLKVPEGVGVSVSTFAFINDIRVLGRRRGQPFLPASLQSEGYEAAERKIRVEAVAFIADVRADGIRKGE